MAGGGRTRRHLRLIRVRNYSIQMIVTCRTYLASVGIEGGLGNSYRGALTVSHRTTTPQQPDLPRGSEGTEGPHTGPASPPSKQNCMVDGVFTEVILVLTNFTLHRTLLRHPHNKKMRSPVHDLAWYQYFLIDVICLVVVAITLLAFVLVKCVLTLCLPTKVKRE